MRALTRSQDANDEKPLEDQTASPTPRTKRLQRLPRNVRRLAPGPREPPPGAARRVPTQTTVRRRGPNKSRPNPPPHASVPGGRTTSPPRQHTENKSHSPYAEDSRPVVDPHRGGRGADRGPTRRGEVGGKETARRNQGARLAQSEGVSWPSESLCLFDPLTARGSRTYIGARAWPRSGSWPHRSRHEHYDG